MTTAAASASKPVIRDAAESHVLFEDVSPGLLSRTPREGRDLQEKIADVASKRMALTAVAADQMAYEGAVKEGYEALKGRISQFKCEVPLHELFQEAVSEATRLTPSVTEQVQGQVSHDILNHYVKEQALLRVTALAEKWKAGDLSNEELITEVEKDISEMQKWYRGSDSTRQEYVRRECFYRPLHEKLSPAITEKTSAQMQYVLHSAQQRVAAEAIQYSPAEKTKLEGEIATLTQAEKEAYDQLHAACSRAEGHSWGASGSSWMQSITGWDCLAGHVREVLKSQLPAEVQAQLEAALMGYEEKKKSVDEKKKALSEFAGKQESANKRVLEQAFKEASLKRLGTTDDARYKAMASIRFREDQKRHVELMTIVTPELTPGMARRAVNGVREKVKEQYSSMPEEVREAINQAAPWASKGCDKATELYHLAQQLPRNWANVKQRVGEYRDGAVASYRSVKNWTLRHGDGYVKRGAKVAAVAVGGLVATNYVVLPVASVVVGTVVPMVASVGVSVVSTGCSLGWNYGLPAVGWGLSMGWQATSAVTGFALSQVGGVVRQLPIVGSIFGAIWG